MVCPGTNGGKNWPAGAYSPRTNAMYMPMQNMCMNATIQSGERDPRLVYGFQSEYIAAPGADKIGVVWAISAEKGTTVWKHEQRVGVMSLAATGGGLVFGGDVAGNFRALDDTTGEVLWETNIGAPVSGYPGVVCRRRQAIRGRDDGPVARRGRLAARDARADGRVASGAGRGVRAAVRKAVCYRDGSARSPRFRAHQQNDKQGDRRCSASLPSARWVRHSV